MIGGAMEILESARNWNVTPAEQAAGYPAHRYADRPYEPLLRALDVAAPPAVVYRWLCQLTLAPYSYDWLDNGGRRSPRVLVPGAERLTIGQRLMVTRIVEFEPDCHITGVALPFAAAVFGVVSLTYQVTPAGPAGSRLVACLDVRAGSRLDALRAGLLAPGDLVMMRKQLRTIKELAEATAVAA